MRKLHHLLLALLALFLLSCLLATSTQTVCLDDQRSALEQVHQDLNFSSESWDPTKDCCSWEGVTCDSNGRVIQLNLSYRNLLSGHLSSIVNLHHIQHLNLAGNDFGCIPIPSGFGRLQNLTHLNLSNSYFSGQIPLEISQLTRLVSLDLSHLHNSCPSPLTLEKPNLKTLIQNLRSLNVLRLDGVRIQAQTDWCEVISQNLLNLRVLSLSSCGLTGPPCSLSSLPFLSILDLAWNFNLMTSFLPANFLEVSSDLLSLNLRVCYLSGHFPERIFRLPKIRSIDIGNNPQLTVQLPEFPSNSSLEVLELAATNIGSKLPDSIANLRFLRTLDIPGCNFFGTIPASIANLTHLEFLGFADNIFIGLIPPFHKDGVPNLQILSLWDNQLKGVIPSSLFTLPSLVYLDLRQNQLVGNISEFQNASSSSLERLHLDDNFFNGQIPESIFELPRLRVLQLGGKGLWSLNLSKLYSLKNIELLRLANVNLLVNDESRNFTFPHLEDLALRSCNLTQFPKFIKTQHSLGHLDLFNNQIHGFIPNWLMQSSSLLSLDLSHNAVDFSEQYPFGALASIIWLWCSSCNISRFPKFISNSERIGCLDLSNNKIHGPIPNWVFEKNLWYLNISRNSLASSDQFSDHNSPQNFLQRSICNLRKLLVFDASYNTFNGQIPDCLGNISSLADLHLEGNNFRGVLPDFAQASMLRSLNVHGNKLEGKLPRSLANCTSLEVLDLGENMIRDTFPFWLHELPVLKVLILRANRFHGPITISKTANAFPMLGILDLALNKFSGELPAELFQCLSAMMKVQEREYKPRYIGDAYYVDTVAIVNKGMMMELVRILTVFSCLDLSYNDFSGIIPEEIKYLKSPVVLNFSHNGFFGNIPPTIGDLTHLESLDLSQNKLSGTIPPQLKSLTFLAVLNLSYNELEGAIPQGNQLDTFSNSSFQGNSRLCGLPLTRKCQGAAGPDSPPSKQDEEDSLINGLLDWKIVSMGYGSGLVIGFSVGYIVLEVTRIKWLSSLIIKKKGRRHRRRTRKRSPRT